MNELPENPAVQTATWAVDAWAEAFHARHLTPGSLCDTPIGALLRKRHGLGRTKAGVGFMFSVAPGSDEQHDQAFTWWSVLYDWGQAARNGRSGQRQPESLLVNFPLGLPFCYEIDQAFDEAYPIHSATAVETENLFNPELTVLRLLAAATCLCQLLRLNEAQTTDLLSHLHTALGVRPST